MNIHRFDQISINGRFIYGYLCMVKAIDHSKSSSVPLELNELFHEFVATDRLDIWHTKVEDVLPSFILNVESTSSEHYSVDTVENIKQYYKSQQPFIVDIIENLFWLGISNLYVGYNSESSLKFLKVILEKMDESFVPLPDFEKIERCSASQKHGWGVSDDLRNYVE